MSEKQLTMNSVDSVELTEDMIREYMEEMTSRGRNVETVKKYTRCLWELRSFLLQEELPLTVDAVTQWHDALEAEGLGASAINGRITAVKGLLEYCGILPETLHHDSVDRTQAQPIPTRMEYLQLLLYLRAFGTKRTYLLVKIFGQIGINIRELPHLTVEACQTGEVRGADGKFTVIPTGLSRELLQYAEEQSIHAGPVIVTRNGRPVNRSNINHMIGDAAMEAGLPPEKFSPSALARMCWEAQDEVRKKLEPLYMKSYEQLLDAEQTIVAWTQT